MRFSGTYPCCSVSKELVLPRREKFLIIKLGALGDLLMATPAMHSLRKAFPEADISLMVGKSCAPVVDGNPDVDRVLEIDDRVIFHGAFLSKLAMVLKIAFRGRLAGYDTIISLHRDRRFAFWSALIGARRRIGLSYLDNDPFLTATVRINGIKHHIDHYLEALSPLGVVAQSRQMFFYVEPHLLEWGRCALTERFAGSPVVCLAPGGARNVKEEMSSRRWPLEHYRDLAMKLAARGLGVVVIGGESDRYVEGIFKHIDRVESFVGETTLAQTAALMASCNLVVTHDSGPMHLAAAVNAPVISLFGPTDPREKAPLNGEGRYLWKLKACEKAPCYIDGDFPACSIPRCLGDIPPGEVLSAVLESLGLCR